VSRPATPMFTPSSDAAEGAMSLPDAAKFLGVGESTLTKLVNAGEVRIAHIGRRVVVLRRSLVEYLDRQAAKESR
jgi:excisionase family DNA binding protein